MNDDLEKLEAALRANLPRPSARDRDRAFSAAMAAFDRHHKETRHALRDNGHFSERGTRWLRRISMPPLRLAVAGTGAVAVLFIAAGIAYQHFLAPAPGGVAQDMAAAETGFPYAPRPMPNAESGGSSARTRSLEMSSVDGGARGRSASRLQPGPPPPATAAPAAGATAVELSDPGYRGRDRFSAFEANPVRLAAEAPVSTFSIDVDTVSYGFVRASLNAGALPPRNAVRTEELVNYFPYGYAPPAGREAPFAVHASLMPTPWNGATRLMHIGIKGYVPPLDPRPRANLVFLIDTSGSMESANRLPLVIGSLKLLLGALAPDDTVAVVTYAGSAGVALAPTRAAERAMIVAALEQLGAGGSTAGAEGIREAYLLAERGFVEGGINRVILATDGDFNVGITDPAELEAYVARKRGGGVFLSVLGFGMGNYNDALMQRLAQSGNGNAAYIDGLAEARKVLVDEATSMLIPIAKDAKIQVEFNPALVGEYRLIGYETRMLRREDFLNDKVDAGEIGAGHAVTALYEVTLAGSDAGLLPPLRYGRQGAEPRNGFVNEFATISIRYKMPDAETGTTIVRKATLADMFEKIDDAPGDIRFAAAVAGFAQLLRGGRYTRNYGYGDVIAAARAARGEDPFGYRAEFIGLVRLAESFSTVNLRSGKPR